MNFYYETKFLEGVRSRRNFFGIKTGVKIPTIDLISIGIVSEDGREYYSISSDFDIKEAWNSYDEKVEVMSGDMRNIFPEGRKYRDYWTRENILRPIFVELYKLSINDKCYINNHFGSVGGGFTYAHFCKLVKYYGKSKELIALEVEMFLNWHKNIGVKFSFDRTYDFDIRLYSYCSSYQHVVLCSLFGKMKNLPEGFPAYTRDVNYMLDEKKAWIENDIEDQSGYPERESKSRRTALADALWNKKLYKFLKKIN